MQISGLQHTQAAQSLTSSSRSSSAGRTTPSEAANGPQAADELDLSAEAQLISQAQATSESSSAGDIRWERVNALREAISTGKFETDQRVSGTVDKILDAFA